MWAGKGWGITFIFSMIDVLPLLSRPTMRMFTCEAHAYDRTEGGSGGRGELECQRASPWVHFFFYFFFIFASRESQPALALTADDLSFSSLLNLRGEDLCVHLIARRSPWSCYCRRTPVAAKRNPSLQPLTRVLTLSIPPHRRRSFAFLVSHTTQKKKMACFFATRALLVVPLFWYRMRNTAPNDSPELCP